MLRTANNVCTLLLVRKTFIKVGERWFRTYVTNALGLSNNCYAGHNLDKLQIKLRGEPTETYEACEAAEYSRVIISSNELRTCIEDHC